MRLLGNRFVFALLMLSTCSAWLFSAETLLLIRHAEKPSNGLGQLSCKGLNRALLLPASIIGKFGEPDFLFAPNPTVQKPDKGISYNYIRPMATIEPLAIKTSKNINLSCGYNDIDCISKQLLSPEYSNKTLLAAWEHHLIKEIVSKIAKTKNVKLQIPEWNSDDFDSIYVLKIDNDTISFDIQKQKLDGQSNECRY